MRTIAFEAVADTVAKLAVETNYNLPEDVAAALKRFHGAESRKTAKSILERIIENADIAAENRLPLCQDTGVSVVFADIGTDVIVDGGGLIAAVNEGVRRGYTDGGLRMSMAEDPLKRGNTGDNTPAVVHTRFVDGDHLTIHFCPKGGGCENMSRLAMLSPGEGIDGVIEFVLETVRLGGGKPCPPLIIGVGIGGNFEYSALLAKRTLLRDIGNRHPNPFYAEFEENLLARINELDIGPMGLGGDTTALEVFVDAQPCHIASLPVSVNIQCHSARHGNVTL